jgi:hypothetical protein
MPGKARRRLGQTLNGIEPLDPERAITQDAKVFGAMCGSEGCASGFGLALDAANAFF